MKLFIFRLCSYAGVPLAWVIDQAMTKLLGREKLFWADGIALMFWCGAATIGIVLVAILLAVL